MGNRKVILCLATAVLLIGIVLLCIVYAGQDTAPFSVEISSGERIETINLWESESGDYYVFLPAYVQPQQVSIHLTTSNTVSINDVQLEEGLKCEVFVPDVQHKLAYSVWGRPIEKNLTFVYSKNIAAMYIDTESGRMDYIHEKKGNEESGNMRLYTAAGGLDCDVDLSVKGRGNTSWRNSEKKPYSISLAEEADLLSLGRANNWILLANSDDYSNMRNKIVLDFAAEMNLLYSPESEWVDLYLNGTYMGLYLLCERNEVHPQRVNIAHENSFLVSLENEYRMRNQNIPYITTSSGKHLRIHYCGERTDDTISSILQSVDNAIANDDSMDPLTGKSVEELINLESWVAKYLIEEIFGNIDAANLSQFFYYDGNRIDGKIVAGPVWDYDHSMGNKSEWQLTIENSLFANREIIEEGFTTPWFFYLSEKKFFYDELCSMYKEVCFINSSSSKIFICFWAINIYNYIII